jgi:hypothetical protein
MKRAFIIGLVLVLSLWAGVIVGKADSGIAASVVPSNSRPVVGSRIYAAVWLQSGRPVGSYSATVNFDPAVLRYRACTGPPAGFVGVSRAEPSRVLFNGVNVYGAGGRLMLVVVTFDVVGRGRTSLDLWVSALAEARTFADLVPFTVVRDAWVVVR